MFSFRIREGGGDSRSRSRRRTRPRYRLMLGQKITDGTRTYRAFGIIRCHWSPTRWLWVYD